MSDEVILRLKHNHIRGIKKSSNYSKESYYSFLGIPYAKPPLGRLRFKPAEPAKPWTNIYNATKEKDNCIQLLVSVFGSEDCLYLNIHIPKTPTQDPTLKAVIVLIHGGSFIMGSTSDEYWGSPEYIMHRNIIYVTIGFRLHVLGFLDLGIPECPGNVGIKDIILALHWIKDNIREFGGDPNNVTIIGPSAGAAVTHFLLLSPLTKDKNLFQKAILSGGYAFQPSMSYQKDSLPIAFKFGKMFSYYGNEPPELLKVLRRQPVDALFAAVLKLEKLEKKRHIGTYVYRSPFLPTIEKIKEGALFYEDPRTGINSITTIPLVVGIAKAESLLNVNVDETPNMLNNDLKTLIKKLFWSFNIDDKTLAEIVNDIQQHYFKDKAISMTELDTIIRLYTGALYSELYETTIEAVIKRSPSTPVYVYQFEYEGKLNFLKQFCLKFMENRKVDGACHFDDFFYWGVKNKFIPEKKDVVMIDTIGRLWTNFAKFGNPNDEKFNFYWNPTAIDNHCYLNINEEVTQRSGKLQEEDFLFWENISKRIKASNGEEEKNTEKFFEAW